jgi:CIC family chloride channel protein
VSLSPNLIGRALDARRSDAPVLAWSLLVGVLVGLIGGGFRFAVSQLESGFALLRQLGGEGNAVLLSVAATVVCVMASMWLVRRFAPETAGSGIQEIEGALDGALSIRGARVLIVKFLGGLLALGSGMVLGREGPTVHMGGALGQWIRERFGLSEEHGRTILAAGAGAGLAAAFNAPLTGMLFVLEEMRPHFRYNVISVQSVLIACVASDVVARALLGNAVAYPVGAFEVPELAGLFALVVLGVVLGLVGWLFNAAVMQALDTTDRLSWTARLAMGAAVASVVGALAVTYPDLTGGGYQAIEDALSGAIPVAGLLVVFSLRFALTLVCFASGVPGGIFAPMVALGTLVGVFFASVVLDFFPAAAIEPGVFMVAGTGALFAATVRAPLTGIVLAAELTGNFGLILPIAIACVTATLVAHALGGQPIYSQLLERTLKSRSEPVPTLSATPPP